MKSITTAEVEKILSKAEITDIENRKGFSSVTADFGNDLVKDIAVKSTEAKEARSLALEVILSEPEGIRGFKIKDLKTEE